MQRQPWTPHRSRIAQHSRACVCRCAMHVPPSKRALDHTFGSSLNVVGPRLIWKACSTGLRTGRCRGHKRNVHHFVSEHREPPASTPDNPAQVST
eukprot:752723-Rhodomonas_salina.2